MGQIKLRNVNPVVFNYNVGIGDTSPSDKLVVNSGSIRIDADNAGEGIIFKSLSGTGNKTSLMWKDGNNAEKVRLIFDENGTKGNTLKLTTNSNSKHCLEVSQDGTMGIGTSPFPNAKLVISANHLGSGKADLVLVNGILQLKETTTPAATSDYGKIYTKSDNKLYFQDGGGTEHEIKFV